MAVTFQAEPPGKPAGYRYDWDEIISTLKSRPGKWATVDADNTSTNKAAAVTTAMRLKNGSVQGTSRNEFEATARAGVVYARYVGKNKEFAGDE